jgi:uncharacterized protein (TIGR03437 family)
VLCLCKVLEEAIAALAAKRIELLNISRRVNVCLHSYVIRLGLLALSVTACALAQVSVLNANYDKQQTGANLQETALQPSLNWNNFGKVGTYAVDGQVYAQPLYVPGVTIARKQYNVVYVATMHNSVYAFNADAPQVTTPLWQVNLGPAVPSGLYNFSDILPEIGILGTPAIDAANQVLFVVANTLPPGPTSVPIFRLHAISLVDGHEVIRMNGREVFSASVLISGKVPGNGAGSSDGSVPFDAFWQLQRPGLMLSNGTLYVGFGSHADTGNYHGWLMGYDTSSLRLKSIFNTSPNGRQSAIWQSGRGPAFDSNGDVYVATGNGDWDGQVNFGESILHLSGTGLALKDWYTPAEWSDLNENDQDLGSAGAILIPNTNLLLVGGKTGMLHLVQADSMGHLGPDNTSTVQSVQVNEWGVFTMVLWSQTNPIVYEFDPAGTLKAFQIVNNQINSTILSQFSPTISSTYCGLSLSANGAQDGIVWLTTGNPDMEGVPGTLHALDATDLSNELWNSDLAAGNRDTLGRMAKFAVPTVANGRVYVPTFSNSVEVYSVLGNSTPASTGIISSIVNSASLLEGALAPGELVTIFGANIGPIAETSAVPDGQRISTTLAGTTVLFDGVAAPVLFTSSDQVQTVVPFGAAGPSTKIEVTYQGNAVASITEPVQAASPAIFSQNGTGGGQGAILDQDGSANSSANPAARGSTVTFYATGGGVTTPASQDGSLDAAPPYPAPELRVSVMIDNLPATVHYAAAAPGMVAGMLQINVTVPEAAEVAPFDQVVLTVGNYSSPTAVMIAVQ